MLSHFLNSVGGKAGLGRDLHDRRAAAKAKRDLRKVGGLLGGGIEVRGIKTSSGVS